LGWHDNMSWEPVSWRCKHYHVKCCIADSWKVREQKRTEKFLKKSNFRLCYTRIRRKLLSRLICLLFQVAHVPGLRDLGGHPQLHRGHAAGISGTKCPVMLKQSRKPVSPTTGLLQHYGYGERSGYTFVYDTQLPDRSLSALARSKNENSLSCWFDPKLFLVLPHPSGAMTSMLARGDGRHPSVSALLHLLCHQRLICRC